jgi:antitoxin VapB
MSLTIEDPETVAAIRRLADESEQSVEEVLRDAVEAVRAARRVRDDRLAKRMAALKDIQERYARMPKSGLKADKAFFDEIGGNL